MAGNYMGNMTFGINFDTSKGISQLKQMQKALSDIGKLTTKDILSPNFSENQLKTLQAQATQISQAMGNSFNTAIGQIDMTKFNKLINPTQMNGFIQNLAKIGPAGYQAFNSLQKSLTQTNDKLRSAGGWADKMLTTLSNTVRWSIATKALQTVTGSIQKAFYFTKDLDTSLNDIRIVTGKNADEMEKFALQATKAAQALGKTTTDYTKASLIYYQQGLNDQEAAARAETTLKAANVTGQSTSEVSEQLTAVWNGYRVSAAETEKYVDKLAKVAASTASDLEELSTGMSKVASAANMMGVDIDQLNAQLSTVISVTRQAPETIGAAFKTVYARMSTIQAGGIDEEDGATLKSYTEKMNQFGISVLDSNGKLRDMGDVIEEIGNKWNTFSREAQVGLAQAMGGTRQYSNLTALFENWDKYQAALKVSQNATGTLQQQQEIYMDSIAAHMKQLTAEAENLYQTIFDADAVKDMFDGLTGIVKTIDDIIKGFGGIKNVIMAVGAALGTAFAPKISQGITNILTVFERSRQQKEMAQIGLNNTQQSKEWYDNFYNRSEEHINTNLTGANKTQQLQELEMQKQISAQIHELDQLYYSHYKTLSESQKEQIKQEKAVLESIRDEAAGVAQLEEEYATKASRMLDSDKVSSATIKDETQLIKNAQAELKKLNDEIKNNSAGINISQGIPRSQTDLFNGVETANPGAEQDFTMFRMADLTKLEKSSYTTLTQRLQNLQQNMATMTTQQITDTVNTLETDINNILNQNGGKNVPYSHSLKSILTALQQGRTAMDDRLSDYAQQAIARKEQISNAIASGVKETQTKVNTIAQQYDQFKNRLPQEVQKTIDEQKVGLDNLLNQMNDNSKVNNMDAETVRETIQRINEAQQTWMKSLTSASAEYGAELQNLEAEGQNLVKVGQQIKTEAEMQKEANLANKINRQQTIQGATQVVAAMGQVAMSVNMVINSFSNLRKMKPHEILLQFAMMAPMAISSITAMKTGIIALGAGLKGAEASAIGFSVALKTAFPVLLAITAVIGAIVAAIYLLSRDPVDELADSLKAAEENTKALKEETETLKATYDSIVSAFNKFDEATKVMTDAKTSTEEYNKALKESNETILDLINNNDKLAKYFERDAEGRIVLKSGYTQADVESESKTNYYRALRGSYISEESQSNLQYEKDIRDVIQDEFHYGLKAFSLYRSSKNSAYSEQGGYMELRNEETYEKQLIDVIKQANKPMTKEEMEEALATVFDPQAKAYVTLSDNVVEKFNTLISKQDDIIAANKFRSEEVKRSLLEQGKYGDFQDQSAAVQQAITSVISNNGSAQIAQNMDNIKQQKYSTAEDRADQIMALVDEYAKANGLTYKKQEDNKFVFENENGDEVKKYISYFAQQAANDVLEEAFDVYMSEAGKDTIEQIKKVDEVTQKLGDKYGTDNLGDALIKAFSGDTDFSFLNNLSVETGKKIKEGIESGDIFEDLPLDGLDDDVRNTFINAINEALDRDYSLSVAIQFEMERTLAGYQAFNGLERQWYEDKKIDDETLGAILDWLESEGLGDLGTKLEEAIGTGKWENISDAINETKKALDDRLKDTNSYLRESKELLKKDSLDKLNDYSYKDHNEVLYADSNTRAKDMANKTKKSLKANSSLGVISSAIERYQQAIERVTDSKLKSQLESDLKVLEEWKQGLESTTEVAEGLNDELTRQEKEVYNVVNQSDGLKEAMLVVGEGWKVAAEDAATFTQNCKDSELYIQKVNQDGSLQINEAGITDMAQRQFEALQNQIALTEAQLEAAQQEAHNYTKGSPEWEEMNQKIEEQVLLLSILRSSFYGLQEAIKTAGTDHSKKSGSTKKPIDAARSVLDVYHDINIVLKEITHTMNILEKRSEYLTGKKLEKNLKNQLSLLKEQNKVLKEKVQIAVDEAATLRTQKVNDDGTKGLSAYGVEFNKDTGEIENYYEVIRKKEAELEAARLQFNKSRSDADEQHYNKVKKELDDLKQDISEYEKYLDDRRQLEEEMYDNLAKQLEVKLKHADLRIEAMVDLSKVKKQILDFQKNMGAWTIDLVLNPDQTAIDAVTTGKASRQVIKSSTKSMTKLTDSASNLADVIRILKDADADTKVEWEGEEYDRTAIPKLAEKLEEMTEDIQGAFDDIKSTVEDARDAYINALQELQDWNQKVMEHFEMTNGMYDHADKLTSLLYGEDSLQARAVHENIATQKTGNLYNQAVEANRIAKESYQEYLDAVKSGDKQVAEEAYSIWSENLQKLNSLTEDLIEARMNLYKTQASRIVSEFDMAVFNGNTMDEYISQWELLNKQADQYLDTVNAEFGVEQLRNKYMQAYNKSIGNTKSREKINKIMQEELAMLKEKDKLTQYDLDRANAKYDLTLKQIALEEARENKTNLRLRRDSQGNYTYQYTANQEEIDKAQGEVDIAKNNLYNMDKDRTNEMVDQTLQLYKDFAAEREAILNDPQYINNQEAMNIKLEELQKKYWDKDNGLISVATKEYAVAAKNVSEDVDEILNDPNHSPGLLNSFNTLVQKGPEAIDELVVGLQDPITDVMNKFMPTAGGNSSVADGVKTCFDDCKSYQNQFLIDVGKFAKDLDEDTALGGVINLYGEASKAVKTFKEKCEEGIDLTQIGLITSAINELASAIGKKGDKTNPSLTGNAEDAFQALKDLIKPDQIKTNLSIIKDNFIKLTGTVNGLKDSFETTIGKVKDLFDLLDQYNNKKWSYEPNIKLPSGGGGSSQRGDGTLNDDDTGSGDVPKETPNTKEKIYYAWWDSKRSNYFNNVVIEGTEKDANDYKNQNVSPEIESTLRLKKLTNNDFKNIPYTLEVLKKVYQGSSSYFASMGKAFDTGGYTGVWGNEGKLAMLHEKELVLNKHDTQKFLDALDIVRQLDVGNLESNMYESFLLAQKKIVSEWSTPDSQSATIQNITINADFPDASDRDEIKAAFDSLVNLASQRAYTKKY